MEGWKEYKISDICTGIYEGPHATPPISQRGGIYLGIPNITKDGHIDYKNAKHISENDLPQWTKRVTPQEDDIVFTNEATLNLYAIIPKGFHGCLGRRLGLIRPDKSVVSVKYLFYYFFSPEWRNTIAQNKVSGATVERILMKKFPSFRVKLPSMSIQNKIAHILSLLDDKIEVNRRINENLEQQAQALFKSWFVDFEPFKNGEFVESELGMIPKGWRVGTFGEIMTITSGKRPLKKETKSWGIFIIPLIGASEIMGYTNTVLFNEKILVTGRVGTHGIVQRFNCACWPSDNTLVLKSVFYEYCYQVLLSIDYSSLNRGSTQPLITQNDLKYQQIIIPPKTVFVEYEEIATILMESWENNNKESRRLAQLRDTLLPRLMSGELKVNEIENVL